MFTGHIPKLKQFDMKSYRMKMMFLTAFATVISGTTITAQKQTGKSLAVDFSQSSIYWTGKKPTGEHVGTVKLTSGELKLEKGEVKNGSFVIDLNSIANTDIGDAGMKEKLVGHLKSPDFFDVATYPTATFEITRVARLKAAENATGDIKATHLVEGNLTMKGVTHKVQFNATISVLNGTLTASSLPFVIDRTKWGVNYQSKSVFSELKDQFINDEITLKIELLAR